MTAKVIPIRPSKGIPRAVRGDYPSATDGVHVMRDGDGYVIVRQHQGRRFEVPITKRELASLFHEIAQHVAIDNTAKAGWTEQES